jgi:alanine dehydrogenase
MIVGVPKEVKDRESRVSVTPAGVHEYVKHGHTVLVETHAGEGSGISDADYAAAGARIISSHEDVFAGSDMIVKVKEPTAAEFQLLKRDQVLFTYLHLANEASLARTLIERNVQAVAYETVQLDNGPLPLLTPMSEVAGRMSIQVGAYYLQRTNGGIGVLLGGVPGVPGAEVVIIGGGIVGTNATQIALGMGANVTILDMNVDRLRYLDEILHGRINTQTSNAHVVAEAVARADLVVGGVLVAGARAPKLVTAEMVRSMRRGSVMVDVAIDQGGCFETSHPTSHSDPIFTVDGVIHYCVTNMPGAVPRTSTFALSNVTLPYGLALADRGLVGATLHDPALAKGVNVYNGQITHAGVAEALGLPYVELQSALLAVAA